MKYSKQKKEKSYKKSKSVVVEDVIHTRMDEANGDGNDGAQSGNNIEVGHSWMIHFGSRRRVQNSVRCVFTFMLANKTSFEKNGNPSRPVNLVKHMIIKFQYK